MVAGAHRIQSGADSEAAKRQRIEVDEIIPASRYAETNLQDIALLHLKTPLSYTDTVQPVCLPHGLSDEAPALTATCAITGWGSTRQRDARRRRRSLSRSKRSSPDELIEAMLPIQPNDVCQAWLTHEGKSGMTPEFELCAGLEQGGKDTCQGDSGGPLVCQTTDGAWNLIGVTSWGHGCGDAKYPGLYTRVTREMEWIKAITFGRYHVASAQPSGYA